MRRMATALPPVLLGFLLLAPAAIASSDNPTGGQGIYGETDDKVVTYAAFILIAAVPLFLWLMTLLQSKLDKRKSARKAAAKAAQGSAGARGGW
ncbi:MAG: hypothetical protein M3Z33_00565 [Actinomycetota bacterium]|nr:hypothetical protein [Actinomycetota bacterium]